MNPGRELDILIAEKVMGLNIFSNEYLVFEWHLYDLTGAEMCEEESPSGEYRAIKPYSTNISAAWEVVEHFRGWDFNIGSLREPALDDWHGWWVSLSGPKRVNICSRSLPHAICLAALKIVEQMKEGKSIE